MKWYAAYAIGGAAGVALGWCTSVPAVYWVLIALIALDFATGIAAAAIHGKVSSEESFRGALRKSIVMMVVAAASAVRYALPVEFPYLGPLVAGAFCAREFISIVENADAAGVKIPQVLRDALEKLETKKPG
jgi:toxin secretion/phage lysis holin